MSTISFTKKDVPFWLNGNGDLSVELGKLNPLQPLPETSDDSIRIDFGVQGQQPFTFGAENTVTAGIKAGTRVDLVPVWASTAATQAGALKPFQLDGFFAGGSHGD